MEVGEFLIDWTVFSELAYLAVSQAKVREASPIAPDHAVGYKRLVSARVADLSSQDHQLSSSLLLQDFKVALALESQRVAPPSSPPTHHRQLVTSQAQPPCRVRWLPSSILPFNLSQPLRVPILS